MPKNLETVFDLLTNDTEFHAERVTTKAGGTCVVHLGPHRAGALLAAVIEGASSKGLTRELADALRGIDIVIRGDLVYFHDDPDGAEADQDTPFVITTNLGVPFLVTVVPSGGKHGLNNHLTNDSPDPMIEFYDQRDTAKFGPKGQFVTSYYAATLSKDPPVNGLCLRRDEPTWTIDAVALAPVLRLAARIANGKPRR